MCLKVVLSNLNSFIVLILKYNYNLNSKDTRDIIKIQKYYDFNSYPSEFNMVNSILKSFIMKL